MPSAAPDSPLPTEHTSHYGNWHKSHFPEIWRRLLEEKKGEKSEQLYLLYALWKHIFHRVPESLRSFVLCTNMSGSFFSNPEQTSQTLLLLLLHFFLLLLFFAGLEVPWDSLWKMQGKERTGGTGIDRALIKHCRMIHDFCQTARVIYGQTVGLWVQTVASAGTPLLE